jgi:hypothetical protein
MEDVTKLLQASASLLLCWNRGGAGLGRKDQNKGEATLHPLKYPLV